MSYMSIAQCVEDADYQKRVNACTYQEGANPYAHSSLMWDVAGKSDIETAYEYALNAGTPSPGADETVITDAMILSAVQSILTPPAPPPIAESKPA